jgi:hypothetical protein
MPWGPTTASLQRILDGCDALLEEVGRREHRFAWLRDELDWLVVDAYYPRHRLVVCCHGDQEQRRRYEEVVPEHGLRVACLDPDEVAADPGRLREQLAAAAGSPLPSHPPAAAANPPGAAPAATALSLRAGLGLGVALTVLAVAEAYLGIVTLALGAGDVVLGFGLTLDACARVLGTLGAPRNEAWAYLLAGSPAMVRQGTAVELPTRAVAGLACGLGLIGLLLAL